MLFIYGFFINLETNEPNRSLNAYNGKILTIACSRFKNCYSNP